MSLVGGLRDRGASSIPRALRGVARRAVAPRRRWSLDGGRARLAYGLRGAPGYSLWACGFNLNGTLGDGTTKNRSSAVPVDALTGIRSIDGSTEFTVLTRTYGSLWAWGSNSGGQFGDGTTGGSSLLPRRIF